MVCSPTTVEGSVGVPLVIMPLGADALRSLGCGRVVALALLVTRKRAPRGFTSSQR